MKTRKRMYALTLAIVLVMSIMAIPVSAAARTSEFAAFLTISANNGSANPGYTRALQRFLMCIDSTNKDAIMNSGGTDGKFGNTTTKLTKNFQKKIRFIPRWYCWQKHLDCNGKFPQRYCC